MSGGFSNQSKILRGAFVEYGVSVPPLIVGFQFNPETISRARAASIKQPCTPEGTKPNSLYSQSLPGTKDFRAGQTIIVNRETLGFEIRLDATDKLNDGDALAERFGIAPQLSTLELMMLPKNQSLLGGAVSALLKGKRKEFAFFDEATNPPIILFIWGRKKVLPVNITNMSIKEEEFSTDLNPVRATVTVSLEVIEGANAPFLYTKALMEAASLLNISNILNIKNTIVPA